MSVIRQKIKNQLTIACDDVDFTTSTSIEVYVKQGSLFFQYTPTVVDAHHMTVDVPLADAMKLAVLPVSLQWALTDANSLPVSVDPIWLTCGEFLKEAGYDPV